MVPPLVTAVIPTWNRAALLPRAVRSVLGQTHGSLTVLILDAASTDATEETARALAAADPRITYVRHQQRIGITEGYQDGLDRVETPYFSFLADDDHLLPDCYESAIPVLEQDVEAGFVAGGLILTFEDGTVGYTLQHWTDAGRLTPARGLERLTTDLTVAWHAVVFRTAAARRFPLDPRLRLAFDLMLMLQVCAAGPSWVLRHPFAVQRIHHATVMGSAPPSAIMADLRLVEQRFREEVAPTLGPDGPVVMARLGQSVDRVQASLDART